MKFKLLILFFIITVSTFGQIWTNYTIDNSGLPSNKISSITIVDKTIWVTTNKGIASFDGSTWKVYSTEEGISSEITNSAVLQKDTSNVLWIATDKGTTSFKVENLLRVSETKYSNTSNSNIPSDSINSIGIDTDFYKWLGTNKGISIITPDSIQNLQIGTVGIKLKSNQINSFFISSDTVFHRNEVYVPTGGVMYVATNGGGVSRFYNHKVDGISSASVVQNKWSGLPSDTVLTVFIDKQNNHWYGTPEGVASHVEHDSKNAEWKNYTTENGLISNRVTAITIDNNGQMLFGTTGGISLFDGETWKSFTQSDGLIGNNVLDIKVDSSNNIWIATNNGLSKLTEIPSSIGNNHEISNNKIVLLQSYPNPFNLSINFSITISQSSKINFQIYNSLGKLIKEIINKPYSKGSYILSWNAQDENDNIINSGIYFARIQTSNMIVTKKIVLLK